MVLQKDRWIQRGAQNYPARWLILVLFH